MNPMASQALRDARQLLPWHINHSLSAADDMRLRTALAASPELKAEAGWLRSVAALLREEPAPPAADRGLATLLARIHAEQHGKVVALPLRRRAWHKPALALAAGVVLAQAVLIANLLHKAAVVDALVTSSTALPAGALLQLTFRETTTEPQIRAVLMHVGGTLVSGPGKLGVYTIKVGSANIDAAYGSLQAEPAINSVTRLARN